MSRASLRAMVMETIEQIAESEKIIPAPYRGCRRLFILRRMKNRERPVVCLRLNRERTKKKPGINRIFSTLYQKIISFYATPKSSGRRDFSCQFFSVYQWFCRYALLKASEKVFWLPVHGGSYILELSSPCV